MSQQKDLKEKESKMRDIFQQLDTSGDGLLTLKELKSAFADTDYSDSDLATIFCDVDLDGDGMITLKEFVLEMTKPNRKRAFEEAFKRFDKDGNGVLCRQEVECLCREVGSYSEADIQKIINSADKNKDGRIDKEEFMALV